MKPMTIILTLFLACAINFSFAQHTIVSINGLEIGKTYTKAQIIAALGEPTTIKIPQPTDAQEDFYTYLFNNNQFEFKGNLFHSFSLYDSAFAVNNILRVGDNISKFDLMGGIKTVRPSYRTDGFIHWRPSLDGIYEYSYLSATYTLQTGVIRIIVCGIMNL